MEVPAPRPTAFPISSPRDLLAKAQREFERLSAEADGVLGPPNPTSIADLTINIAWTLWHVTDWIGNNSEPAVAALLPSKGITGGGCEAFQRQLRTESPDLEICWALALRFKHFDLEPGSRATGVLEDAYVSVAPAPYDAQAPMLFQSRVVAMPAVLSGTPAEGVPVTFSLGDVATVTAPLNFTLHPKVNSGGERLRLIDVYRRAYTYLDQLLKKNGL